MPLPTTASSRSLGTTIMVSTFFRISAMPLSACFIRRRPSKRNGLVTIPTVRAPLSRAICETTGAAPGAGAAAHAAGDEDHVGALHRRGDLVAVLLDGLPADLRAGRRRRDRV